MQTIAKPAAGMFKPFSGAYISLVEDSVSVEQIWNDWTFMNEFFLTIPEEKWKYRYADGKWTLKEMLIHITDTERIFSYRALRIARNDNTPLPGFEQDNYVSFCQVENRSVQSILDEWEAVRKSTYLLFQSFDGPVWDRFTLVDNHPVSVRALLYLVLGHARHHLSILKERYL